MRYRNLPPRTIGLTKQGIGGQVFAGVCSLPLSLAAVALSFGLTMLLRFFEPGASSLSMAREFVTHVRDQQQLGVTIVFLLIAAANEEILFRGLLLTRMRRICDQWVSAVIIVSLLFGAIHLDVGFAYARNAFCLSLVWSYLYIRTGSLLSVTVGHFLLNCALFLAPKILGLQ